MESLGSSLVLADAQDVEADSLGQGAALADSDLVAGLDTESGRAVRGEVLVALFVSAVLGDAMGESALFSIVTSNADPGNLCLTVRQRLRTRGTKTVSRVLSFPALHAVFCCGSDPSSSALCD